MLKSNMLYILHHLQEFTLSLHLCL